MPNMKALGLIVSEKKIFKVFSYINLCKTCDPPGRGHFWPWGHDLNKLGRGPLGDATYQILKLLALRFQRRRFYNVFPI